MARVLRVLGLLCAGAAGMLLLPWGAFALYAAVTFNNGGSLWTHPAIVDFLTVQAVLLAAAAFLLGLAALLRRRAQSAGDK